MILLDYNQIVIANFMANAGAFAETSVEENAIRHMILNTIKKINVMFRHEFGEMVITCDSKDVWRKDVFPYYKANRKKERQESDVDWNELYRIMDLVKQELKTHFPYRVLELAGAEADDIIGTLVRTYSANQPIMISSRDKDFIQLHIYDNVKQYDSVTDKMMTHPDPRAQLVELILKGDSKDGVPNYLMADDTFINKIRQRPVTQKKN